MSKRTPQPETKTIRCAVYTRKSTEEGLEQEFNSLDAQRESAEAFICAQRHEGWNCLPQHYDDGGFSGGNLERPAMRRLLADIDGGKVDCVVVYKVDRLSRSLMDFARVMQTFERHGVTFVSVTQSFRTNDSMGRLTLNILLSFAQFEREIISERTRDKIAAARRKGKFSGGKPLLGYDIVSSPAGAKLIVNEDEATIVREIFELYLREQALIPVVRELAQRGWCNKRWTMRSGEATGGRPFDKTTLYRLLTNRTYTGVVSYGGDVYAGEHLAIVEPALWERVRAVLGRNGKPTGRAVSNRYGALLKGLLHCSCCKCSMTHAYTAKQGRRYRYYVCAQAQKKGWASCPSKSVPAGEIERFVVEQIKAVGRDPAVLEGTLRQMRQQHAKAAADLRTDQKFAERELGRHHAALKKLAAAPDADALAALHDQIRTTEKRLADIRDQLQQRGQALVEPEQVRRALAAFDPMWDRLPPDEQVRLIRLLVQRVDYDGSAGTVSVTFSPTGLSALAREQNHGVAA